MKPNTNFVHIMPGKANCTPLMVSSA